MTEIVRKDAKERVVGDKSFVGDQEIVGKFLIRDRNFNTIYEFDPNTNKVTVYDINGNIIWQANTSTGKISGIPKEYYLPLIMSGATSGGFDAFYTNMAVPQYLWPTYFKIDPDDYDGASFYLEAIYRAGTSGGATRTCSIDLYDIAAAAVVTNSKVSGSEQAAGSDPFGYCYMRGATSFRGNLTPGERSYVARYYKENNTDANDFIDLYKLGLVIKY